MNKISFKTYIQDDYIVKEALTTIENIPNLYFKFPKQFENDLTDRADSFVYALIFLMMQEGGSFEIEGNVSKSVLDNMIMFAKIWNLWRPDDYKQIEIFAQEIKDDYRPENKKMITAFSGGLDSAYTAYKYKKDLDKHFKYDLDRAVMILGADIPIKDKEIFDIAFSKAKKMNDDLGIELIPVETNFRFYKSNWEHCFAVVVLAALSFFSKKYFYGVAANGGCIKRFVIPWGMNPITDRYLSSDTFRFIIDGYMHTRTERANIVKDWKVGLENLRVCYQNKNDLSQNCGHCEKCIRTKLNFLASGVSYLPAMSKQFSINDIINDNLVSSSVALNLYKEIYDYGIKNSSLSPEILKVLKKQLNIWEKNIYKKENSLFKKFKKKFRSFFRIKQRNKFKQIISSK